MTMASCGPTAGLQDYDDWRCPRTLEWKRLVTGDDVPLVLAPSFEKPLLPATTVEVPNPLHTRSAQQWFTNLPDDTARAIMDTRRSMLREQQILDNVLSMHPKPPARETRPTADMVLQRLAALRQVHTGRRQPQPSHGAASPAPRPGSAPPGPGPGPHQRSGTGAMHRLGVRLGVSQPAPPQYGDPALQPQPNGLPPPLSVIIARQQQQRLAAAGGHAAGGQAAGAAQQGKIASMFRAISPFKNRPASATQPPLPGQAPWQYPQQLPQSQPQQQNADPNSPQAPWYHRMWRRGGGSGGGTAPPAPGNPPGQPDAVMQQQQQWQQWQLQQQQQQGDQAMLPPQFPPQMPPHFQPQLQPQGPPGADLAMLEAMQRQQQMQAQMQVQHQQQLQFQQQQQLQFQQQQQQQQQQQLQQQMQYGQQHQQTAYPPQPQYATTQQSGALQLQQMQTQPGPPQSTYPVAPPPTSYGQPSPVAQGQLPPAPQQVLSQQQYGLAQETQPPYLPSPPPPLQPLASAGSSLQPPLLPPPLPASDGGAYGLEAETAPAEFPPPLGPPLPPVTMVSRPASRTSAIVSRQEQEYGLGADVAEAEVDEQMPRPAPQYPVTRNAAGAAGGLLRVPSASQEPREALEPTAEQRMGFAPPSRRRAAARVPVAQVPVPTGPRVIQRKTSIDDAAGDIEDVEEEFGLGAETDSLGVASLRPAGLPPARQLAASSGGGGGVGRQEGSAFSFAAGEKAQVDDMATPQKMRKPGILPTPSKLPPSRFHLVEEDF